MRSSHALRAVHEIMGSRNPTGKKGVNLAEKGVKIEFS
jgi:hypothetical protein